MAIDALVAELSGLGVVLRIEGDRLAFDAPAGVITDDLLGRMRSVRDGLMGLVADRDRGVPHASLPDASRLDRPTTIRCPWCGGIDLSDDGRGLRCCHCDRLAWVATVEGGLARRDVADSVIELVDPDLVPVCPTCGAWCDVMTLAGSWRCSQCDPEAKDRRLRTKRFNLLARSALKKKATEDHANAI
jgi:tRNA(Ile2) C34 agmatinyltransferase TiaS